MERFKHPLRFAALSTSPARRGRKGGKDFSKGWVRARSSARRAYTRSMMWFIRDDAATR